MTVAWQPWMRWIDQRTGKLKPLAPPWIRKRYRKYQADVRALEAEIYPDVPAPDENGEVPMPEWVSTEELIRRAEEQTPDDPS